MSADQSVFTIFAWRTLSAGYRIEYRGDLEVIHPRTPPSRHAEYYFRSARNRAWLARRRLPWPLAAVYVPVWVTLSFVRSPRPASWPDTFRGWKAGFSESAGEREPMDWATALRMTRLGRPPII